MLLKYQLDWMKTVDFLLTDKFWTYALFYNYVLVETEETCPNEGLFRV